MTNSRVPRTPPRDPTIIEAPPVKGATVPVPPAGPEAEGAEPDGAGVVAAVAVG